VRGFGVDSFDLAPVQEGSQSGAVQRTGVTWQKPEGAAIVVCAVFACSPEVPQGGQSIINYDECVISKDEFDSATGTFDLRLDLTRYTPDAAADGCAPLPRRMTTLVAGCWAYDLTHVVAATPLLPLSADEVFGPTDPQAPATDCADAASGATCSAPEFATFGSCHAGSCLRRCLRSTDCDLAVLEAPDAGDDGGDAGAAGCASAHRSRCQPFGTLPLDQYLGVCVAEGGVP